MTKTTTPTKRPKTGGGKKGPITDKVLRFVDEYLIDLNGGQAATRAGYSARTADTIACELLRKPAVLELLRAKQAERAERTKIDADWLLTRLAAQADADVKDLLNDDGSLKPVSEWPSVWRRGLVAGIEVLEEFEGTGEDRKRIGVLKKVKLTDRMKSLELIGKHVNVGAFREKVEHSGPGGAPLPATQVVPIFNVTLTKE